jgi:hypothetical protein
LRFGDISVTVNSDGEKFYLSWSDFTAELEPFSTYMVILKWNARNLTIDMNVYLYVHRSDMPPYLLKPEMYWWDFENPIFNQTGDFNKAFNLSYVLKKNSANNVTNETVGNFISEGQCQIHGWPVAMTNIKYYRGWMSDEDILKETIKYTTNHEQCVINDLARPILDGHGYAVR